MPWHQIALLSKTVAVLVGIYAVLVGLLTTPWLQRQALYLHHFNTAWWHSPAQPESFGFPKGQVTPYYVRTADNETLFAWHILPFELYAKHSDGVLTGEVSALDLLRRQDSKVVVNFHGNAGDIAQGYRTESLKLLSASTGPDTHIITFDYRGFGYSTGYPSEQGLISDGCAILDWIITTGHVQPERIAFLGHSLGTAVATGVYERLVVAERQNSKFAGLILIAPFTDVPTLLKTYLLGGFLPILSPLKHLPSIQAWLTKTVVDTWTTAERIRRIMNTAPLYLEILHSRNDQNIRSEHADLLFDAAIGGRTGFQWAVGETLELERKILDGTWQRQWRDTADSSVTRTVIEHAKHNDITTYLSLALVVRKVLGVD